MWNEILIVRILILIFQLIFMSSRGRGLGCCRWKEKRFPIKSDPKMTFYFWKTRVCLKWQNKAVCNILSKLIKSEVYGQKRTSPRVPEWKNDAESLFIIYKSFNMDLFRWKIGYVSRSVSLPPAPPEDLGEFGPWDLKKLWF